MTDEVADLVLADNINQNDLMGTSRANAPALLNVHARQIAELEQTRGLNRELEALPTDKGDTPASGPRNRAHLTGIGHPDGPRQACAEGRSAGQ